MNKAIFIALHYFFFGFFVLLSIAPLNQSLAVGVGQSCSYGTRVTAVNCDSNLYCDASADTSGQCESGWSCRGICRKTCTVYSGGPANGGCAATEVCNLTGFSSGYGGSGYCILDTAPHVTIGGHCTAKNATDTQGNCTNGLFCQRDVGSTTKGICFPNPYTCNQPYESRSGITAISCSGTDSPLGIGSYTCLEDHNTKPTGDQTCTNTCDYDGVCSLVCTYTCPNCTWSCRSVSAVVGNCTCDQSGVKGGFTCTNQLKQTGKSSCSSLCFNDSNSKITDPNVFGGQTLSGIKCTTPPPPAPPCVTFIGGICISVSSSLGNLSTDPGGFVGQVFGIVLAASGAIAVVLIMRAGYQIMTARGNPEGIQKGREQIIAAIVGLMFLIFSFILLQVIGGDILQIPNFGNKSSNLLGKACQKIGGACAPQQACQAQGGKPLGKSDCGNYICCKF